MTWTIMMTQKELCIKPYGFLVGIHISSFSLIEMLLINQEVANKNWLKTEGISAHSTWTYSLDIIGDTTQLDFRQL